MGEKKGGGARERKKTVGKTSRREIRSKTKSTKSQAEKKEEKMCWVSRGERSIYEGGRPWWESNSNNRGKIFLSPREISSSRKRKEK